MSNRHKIVYETRSARQRRQLLMKAGVWVFIVIFGLSVVGGVLAIGVGLATHR
ncbi:MAG: hypothetical protein M3Y21_03260 [Candidatus Eremiobacteraeota bacterium]|nr:hypothetical protein [Candidatus Eremiobacteraeota bacterium]